MLHAWLDAHRHGAASLGMLRKEIIKKRSWNIRAAHNATKKSMRGTYAPQVIKIDALKRDFDKVANDDLEVIDDVK